MSWSARGRGPAFLALVLATVALVVACSDSPQPGATSNTSPGSTTTRESQPFQMASASTGDGPTTVPTVESAPGEVPSSSVAPPPRPTTTTTLVPLEVPDGDAICGAALTLAETLRGAPALEHDIDELRSFVSDHFRTASDQLAVAGPETDETASLLEARAVAISEADDLATIIDLAIPILLHTDPVMERFVEVVRPHLETECPDLAP